MNLKQAIKNLLDSARPHEDWTGTNWEVDKDALDNLRRAYEKKYGEPDEWQAVVDDLS